MLGYVIRNLRRSRICVFITLISITFYILQILITSLLTTPKQPPILLWWTPFMAQDEQEINCGNKKCLLTKNRSYIQNPHLKALLFYGSTFDYLDLPVNKSHIWALFHEESPRNVAIFLNEKTFDEFEVRATFSRFSEYPLTLQYLENISVITDTKYFVRKKDKDVSPVLYLQSDCDTPNERDNYVSELMKYIPIDSYGACLQNKEFPSEVSGIEPLDLYNPKILKFLGKYKFMIAFENAICEDYITEKLWRPLSVGTVPIYMGSPSIKDWLPNPNSAILVNDFKNPKSLAEFILKISVNDTLYQSFLEHKQGKVGNSLLKQMLAKGPFGLEISQEQHPIPGFECFVCETVHTGIIPKKGSHPIYDCPKPKNIWENFWKLGECHSKLFKNFVKNHTKIKSDLC